MNTFLQLYADYALCIVYSVLISGGGGEVLDKFIGSKELYITGSNDENMHKPLITNVGRKKNFILIPSDVITITEYLFPKSDKPGIKVTGTSIERHPIDPPIDYPSIPSGTINKHLCTKGESSLVLDKENETFMQRFFTKCKHIQNLFKYNERCSRNKS